MGGHSSLVIEDTSVELILSLELYLQNFLHISAFLPKYLFILLPPLVSAMCGIRVDLLVKPANLLLNFDILCIFIYATPTFRTEALHLITYLQLL